MSFKANTGSGAESLSLADPDHSDSLPIPGLTSLVDVVFILLTFFMLASNFSQWQVWPLLMAGEQGGIIAKEQQPLIITVDSDSLFEINRQEHQVSELDFEQLQLQLKQIQQRDKQVLIVTKDDVVLQTLTRLFDVLQLLGFENVSFSHQGEWEDWHAG